MQTGEGGGGLQTYTGCLFNPLTVHICESLIDACNGVGSEGQRKNGEWVWGGGGGRGLIYASHYLDNGNYLKHLHFQLCFFAVSHTFSISRSFFCLSSFFP